MSIEILSELFKDIQSRYGADTAHRFDHSLVGRVAAIQQITLAVDTYGFDTVAGWLRNIGHIHGRKVTVTPDPPSPGTATDPRR